MPLHDVMNQAPGNGQEIQAVPQQRPLLAARSLNKTFKNRVLAAVDVTLEVNRGETLGIVGESGSGKSTTGKMLLHLLRPDSGTVEYDGVRLDQMSRERLRALRKKVQLVPQNPRLSLNPRLSIEDSIEFNLRAHKYSRRDRKARVLEVLDLVGIPSAYAGRRPHEMSGGQLQRIAIARALATSPDLILCDEPVSSLDQSVQAHILNLLSRLQEELGVAYIVISHDMAVIEHIADTVAVMYLGRVVEVGPALDLWREPRHPYTKALLSAIPGRQRMVLGGDRPDPARPPSGCVFRTLCPFVMEKCSADPAPELLPRTSLHRAACHLGGSATE